MHRCEQGRLAGPELLPPACVTVGWEGGTGSSHTDRQTDWAEAGPPADVPPARVIADPPPPPASKLTLKVGKAKLRQAPRSGLKLQVNVPAAGKLTGSARRGAKTVGGGQGRAKGAGTATLTLRFSKKVKRTLAHGRRPKLTVKVAFTASGAKKATYATTTIGLR